MIGRYSIAMSLKFFALGILLLITLGFIILAIPSHSLAHGGGGGMDSEPDHAESLSSSELEKRKALIVHQQDNEKFSAELSNIVMNMTREMQFQRASGSSERDFAALSIRHNQGFIELAEAELKYGKSPELRLATEKMIAEKKKEIEVLKNWMKSN